MSDQFVIALDQGTTSSRAIVFDRKGSIRGIGQREFTQHYPKPGWVEHDALEIWSSQEAVLKEAVHAAGIRPQQVRALGITNQRETTIIWDRRTGTPIHRAIVWQCRRTSDFCDDLISKGHAALFRERTGLVLDAYFSGTKVKWLLDNVPGARSAAEKGELAFGTVDTWLLWNLTGGAVHATDVTNAARTMLFNIHTLEWDRDLLGLLDIPESLMPEVRTSSGEFGLTSKAMFDGVRVPVAGIAGDQHAALFGQAAFTPGTVKNTYGTGCFILVNTGVTPVASENRLLTTPAWSLPLSASGAMPGTSASGDDSTNAGGNALRTAAETTYALEGSVFIAGAAVQWLRDSMGLIENAAQTEASATSVPDSGGVFVVPAFVGLGAPHWDSYARGGILGITGGTSRNHVIRATLESIAYQSRDVLEAMAADEHTGLSDLQALRVDGGASANNFLMQFQADILGLPVERPKVAETTALGAAYLAGLATGYWESIDEISKVWELDRRFEPAMPEDRREELYATWKKAVSRVSQWERHG